jgi:hypothetical protein
MACSCDWSGNFLNSADNSELVAVVKITEYHNFFELTGASVDTLNQPLSATFEIIELLSGTEQRKEVMVFGDSGYLCRPYINYLKKGEYYIVALNRSNGIDHGNGVAETSSDYYLTSCGEYWANFNMLNQTANGFILSKKKRRRDYSINDIRKRLRERKK